MNRPFFGPMSFRTDGTVLPGALYMPHIYSVFPYAPSESWRVVNELHQEITSSFGVCVDQDHFPIHWHDWHDLCMTSIVRELNNG